MAFLQTSGTGFTLNGQPFFIRGCTIYDDLFAAFSSRIPDKLTACLAAGYNTIRFTNFLPTGAAVGSEYDETTFAHIDWLLNQCRLYGLKVIFETTDVSTVATQRGYDNGDANWIALYQAYYAWLPNRVNTVNGLTYKNDDTIIMWSMVGEYPDPAIGGGTRPSYTPLAATLSANDPNHLICPGGSSHPEQIVDSSYGHEPGFIAGDWATIPGVDLVGTDSYYSEQAMTALFPELRSYTVTHNVPWIVMEFGYNQSVSTYKNDNNRSRHIRFVYDEALQNGCAGFILWNYDSGFGGGYGVNPQTASSYRIAKIYNQTTAYSPRLKVI